MTVAAAFMPQHTGGIKVPQAGGSLHTLQRHSPRRACILRCFLAVSSVAGHYLYSKLRGGKDDRFEPPWLPADRRLLGAGM